jgi:prolyl oligopeptidase
MKVDTVDSYHGTPVPDPFRWLELDSSAAVTEWVAGQNQAAMEYLKAIPFRAKLRNRLQELLDFPRHGVPTVHGAYLLYTHNSGLQSQNVYCRRPIDGGDEVVVLDPNTLSKDGSVRVTQTSVSWDAHYLAYAVSAGRSDWAEIRVMDFRTLAPLDDRVRWVRSSGIAWHGNGFYYSRYPSTGDTLDLAGEITQDHRVYFHKLGDPQSADELVFQDLTRPKRLHVVQTLENGRFLVMSKWDRSEGRDGNALFLREAAATDRDFRPIVNTFDARFRVIDNIGTHILVLTNAKAPNGRLVLIDADHPEEKSWQTLVAEQPDPLVSAFFAGGKLVLTYLHDVTSRLVIADLNGRVEHEVALPGPGTVGAVTGRRMDPSVYFAFSSFTIPSLVERLDVFEGKADRLWSAETPFDGEKYQARQVFYPAKDGVRIPMFIVSRKGIILDGSNPTMLTGSGGFGMSYLPAFNPLLLAWLEQGGIYAVANIRGGGEYGERWHAAGMKLRKQTVFDDFAAAAEWLIAERYTTPRRLAVQGSANGGLLVGAVVNQHPDLFCGAVTSAGVMDMLRFHRFPTGWNWIAEYGSSRDSAEFKALWAYSPVHNIREGTEYPAILAMVADRDERIAPVHTYKYVASVQEKYHGPHPVLLRVETAEAAGAGTSARFLDATADQYAFLFHLMGVTPSP